MKEAFPIQKYRLLPKKQEETQENEIRVKSQARPFVYAAYAGKLLFEKKHEMVHMLATGPATAKVIQSVEYIRKRLKGLHVTYEIESTEFVDEYSPLEEGLDPVLVKRLVPTLKAHLTLTQGGNYTKMPGYMAPLPVTEILDEEKFKQEVEEHFKKERPPRRERRDDDEEGGYRERRGRLRGTGFRGGNNPNREYRGERREPREDREGEYRGPRRDGDRNQGGRNYPRNDQGEERRRYRDDDGDNYGRQNRRGYGGSRGGDRDERRPNRGDQEGGERRQHRGDQEGGERGNYRGERPYQPRNDRGERPEGRGERQEGRGERPEGRGERPEGRGPYNKPRNEGGERPEGGNRNYRAPRDDDDRDYNRNRNEGQRRQNEGGYQGQGQGQSRGNFRGGQREARH